MSPASSPPPKTHKTLMSGALSSKLRGSPCCLRESSPTSQQGPPLLNWGRAFLKRLEVRHAVMQAQTETLHLYPGHSPPCELLGPFCTSFPPGGSLGAGAPLPGLFGANLLFLNWCRGSFSAYVVFLFLESRAEGTHRSVELVTSCV